MFLIAINLEKASQRVTIELSRGDLFCCGRKPEATGEMVKTLAISWSDRLVSRSHFSASLDGDHVVLRRLLPLPGRNEPNVLYSLDATSMREAQQDPVRLRVGEGVVVGAKGTTAFLVTENKAQVDAILSTYRSRCGSLAEINEVGVPMLRQQQYDDVEQLDEYSLRLQLKLIQRELPEQVLSGWTNRQELFARAAAFIENALPGQKGVTAAFIAVDRNRDGIVQFERLNPDASDRADFRPSLTLLNQLSISSPSPKDVHMWTIADNPQMFSAESLSDKIDWVMAVPVAPLDDEGVVHRDRDLDRPVYLYVETRRATESSGMNFLPFVRLITALVASLLSARDQQRIQDRMSTYFSPGLRNVMREGNDESLQPTMADCTIMFADRRGSSHLLERAKTDEEILDRLKENQDIVGLITELVFNTDGVITDFAGDGALSLWGWPQTEKDKRVHALNAVESAEAIVEQLVEHGEFEEEHDRFMSAIRLGISTGRVAVGKTGPNQQWHISVFGGVANLGARLERIAKEFKVPVLLSDETYQRVAGSTNRRFRKLCLINPAGFNESYPIYELILPKEFGGSGASDQDVATYEQALALFVKQDWSGSIDLLNSMPSNDEPAAWLRERAEIFRISPPRKDWNGEIASLSK